MKTKILAISVALITLASHGQTVYSAQQEESVTQDSSDTQQGVNKQIERFKESFEARPEALPGDKANLQKWSYAVIYFTNMDYFHMERAFTIWQSYFYEHYDPIYGTLSPNDNIIASAMIEGEKEADVDIVYGHPFNAKNLYSRETAINN